LGDPYDANPRKESLILSTSTGVSGAKAPSTATVGNKINPLVQIFG